MPRALAVLFVFLVAISAFADDELYFYVNSTPPGAVVEPGGSVTFRAVLRNAGGLPAKDVAIHFPLPPGRLVSIRPESDEWKCTEGANDVTCTRATLPVTDITTDQGVNFTVQLSTDPKGMRFQGVATATAAPPKTFIQSAAAVQAWTYGIFPVKSTADSGPDTLRAVIEETNGRCGEIGCRIVFELPPYSTIELLSPLPVITSCSVQVRGNQQITGDRRVEITGRRLATGSGFEFGAASCEGEWHLEDLAINDFPDYGVLIRDRGPNVYLTGLFIGTDITGKIARPNTRGVGIFREPNIVNVSNSIVSGNRRSGVFFWNGVAGVRTSLVTGNGASGLFTAFGSLILVSTEVAHNGEAGVAVSPHARTLIFQDGSLHSNGTVGIDWNLDGPSPSPDDPRIPQPPSIADAFFDAAKGVTVVTGTFSARSVVGSRMRVDLYASRALNASGHAEGERYLRPFIEIMPDGSSFRAEIREDLRGQIITATVSSSSLYEGTLGHTTELSAGVTVR